MAQSACDSADPQEVLRDALEQMLVSVKAAMTAAAAKPYTTTSNEREALEERRQRLLRLLADLPVPPPLRSPHLFSPSEIAEVEDKTEEADASLRHETNRQPSFPSPPRRLLGNVFATPIPHIDTSAHHYRSGRARKRRTHLSPSPSPPWEESAEEAHHFRDCERDEIQGDRHLSRVADHQTASAMVAYPVRRARSPLTALVPLAAAATSSGPSPRSGPVLYDYTCVPPTFWIHVWPCFGAAVSRTSRPTRVLVRGCYRYFEDVVERAAAQTGCQPVCPALYTPEGLAVRELDGLVAGAHYLLFPSGGFYRTQAVPTALLWLLYKDARHVVQCS